MTAQAARAASARRRLTAEVFGSSQRPVIDHRGKHATADQQRERQRHRRARGVGRQQKGRLRARAVEGRA
jgi:hypothetical protein